MKVRKFIEGAPIPTLFAAVDLIMAGSYVMMGDRPTHPSFLQSMKLITLANLVRNRHLRFALLNPHHPDYRKDFSL